MASYEQSKRRSYWDVVMVSNDEDALDKTPSQTNLNLPCDVGRETSAVDLSSTRPNGTANLAPVRMSVAKRANFKSQRHVTLRIASPALQNMRQINRDETNQSAPPQRLRPSLISRNETQSVGIFRYDPSRSLLPTRMRQRETLGEKSDRFTSPHASFPGDFLTREVETAASTIQFLSLAGSQSRMKTELRSSGGSFVSTPATYPTEPAHVSQPITTSLLPINSPGIPCLERDTFSWSPGSSNSLTPEQHSCSQCSRGFSRKWDLKKHMEAVHLKFKPFECDDCGRKFGHKGTFTKHHRAVHLKLRPHKCPVLSCGMTFSEKGNVNKHLRSKHS